MRILYEGFCCPHACSEDHHPQPHAFQWDFEQPFQVGGEAENGSLFVPRYPVTADVNRLYKNYNVRPLSAFNFCKVAWNSVLRGPQREKKKSSQLQIPSNRPSWADSCLTAAAAPPFPANFSTRGAVKTTSPWVHYRPTSFQLSRVFRIFPHALLPAVRNPQSAIRTKNS